MASRRGQTLCADAADLDLGRAVAYLEKRSRPQEDHILIVRVWAACRDPENLEIE